MIPIKDDNPTSSFPFFTIVIIALNVMVHFYQMFLPPEMVKEFVMRYAAIPNLIIHGEQLYTPVTSMFLHADILHLGGNMLYLWIFGDNIEHICGHFRFVIFYLCCGLVAFFSHFIIDPSSAVPMVGASGAISGILGAYLLRFPRARVHVLFWFFIFIKVIQVPALFVLGIWFLINILNSVQISAGGGGVAWLAHIGGFIAGFALIKLFEGKRYRISY